MIDVQIVFKISEKADFPNGIIDFGSLCLVRTIGHQTAIDVCILHLGKHFLVPFDGLRPTGQQTDEGGLGGRGLDNPTARAMRFGIMGHRVSKEGIQN